MKTFATPTRKRASLRRHPAPRMARLPGSVPTVRRAEIRHILHGPRLQAKLTIGAPNDAYEREADRVADAVMRMPEPSERIQRVCEECQEELRRQPEEEEELLQTQPVRSQVPEVLPDLEARIQALRSGGRPLSQSARDFFEPRFGHDFGGVRVHAGPQAARTAGAVSARAFAVGQDIVFGRGEYSPGTVAGRRLIAHELVHTLQQGGRESRLQRAPACKNQKQADDIIAKNPRKYAAGVWMFLHEIVSGDTLTSLAKGIKGDNKVVSIADLVTELKALNAGVKTGSLGHCVVLIKGWTSPAWERREKRFNCDERIAGFLKDAALARFADWERETVTDKDSSYHPLVDRVAGRRAGLFTGRREEYVSFVEGLNDPWVGPLNKGECVAFPVGWVDPNIGNLPAKPAAGALTDDAKKAIATVYSEQTRASANGQTQQRYIWYSIRKRVGTAIRGPDLDSVLAAGEYRGIGSNGYQNALRDLENPKPQMTGVAKAKDAVLDNWDNAVPANAGAFYFHWRAGSTPEKCFAGSAAKTVDGKEKECAWKWAKKKGWEGSVNKAAGWHHRLRGDSAAPDERIGSMYIYP